MRRQEFAHHTPEQIEGYLRDAADLVERAEVLEEYRQAAYVQAVQLLAAKQIIFEQAAPIGLDLSSLTRK